MRTDNLPDADAAQSRGNAADLGSERKPWHDAVSRR